MFLPSIERRGPCLPFRPSASLSWLPSLPHRPFSTANFSLKISGAVVWLSARLGKWQNLPLISTEKLFSCPLQHQRVLQAPSHSIPSLPATLQLVSLRLFSSCCCHRCYLPREVSSCLPSAVGTSHPSDSFPPSVCSLLPQHSPSPGMFILAEFSVPGSLPDHCPHLL